SHPSLPPFPYTPLFRSSSAFALSLACRYVVSRFDISSAEMDLSSSADLRSACAFCTAESLPVLLDGRLLSPPRLRLPNIPPIPRSEEHTSELQSLRHLV